MKISRNGRRTRVIGCPEEVLEFALQEVRGGGKARLFVRWDRSFHDPHFELGAISGEAVRRPMTEGEMIAFYRDQVAQMARRFDLSRRAD